MRSSIIVCLTAVCMAAPAHAWNDRGHMLSAMVAYEQLSPEVRNRVNAILKDHPQRDLLTAGGPANGPDLDEWVFAKAATWPDMVRSTTNSLHGSEHHGQWHYINYPVILGSVKAPAPTETWDGQRDPENLVQAMTKVGGEIMAPGTTPDRRAMDLCWIEHLVGDIHQPLHAVALFSSQFPAGDRGGNSFAVKRGQTPTSLHSYWDGVLGARATYDTLKQQLEAMKANPELSPAKLTGPAGAGKVTQWAKESVELAKSQVYRSGSLAGVAHISGDYPQETPALPSGYEESAKHLAARQVVLAGYRMADLLNAKLADPASVKPATGIAAPAQIDSPKP